MSGDFEGLPPLRVESRDILDCLTEAFVRDDVVTVRLQYSEGSTVDAVLVLSPVPVRTDAHHKEIQLMRFKRASRAHMEIDFALVSLPTREVVQSLPISAVRLVEVTPRCLKPLDSDGVRLCRKEREHASVCAPAHPIERCVDELNGTRCVLSEGHVGVHDFEEQTSA